MLGPMGSIMSSGSGGGGSNGSLTPYVRSILLGSFVVILVLCSLLWSSYGSCPTWRLPRSSGAASLLASFDSEPIEPGYAALHHLVLVAGHAVLTSLDVHDLAAPENWQLMDYQRDQVGTFVAHIRRGVELTRADPEALLIFSGGETRREAGPRSEAQSYWMAASHAGWWRDAPPDTTLSPAQAAAAALQTKIKLQIQPQDEVSRRATTEEYARDSFENLMFSICRFRELTGSYPRRITVVGFEFKRDRFLSLHRAAVRFPVDHFSYEGIDPPVSPGDIQAIQRQARMIAAEHSQSLVPFQTDPYACTPGGVLMEKKLKRNPFRRHHAYEQTCGEMAGLMRWCANRMYDGDLPWSKAKPTTDEAAADEANRSDP